MKNKKITIALLCILIMFVSAFPVSAFEGDVDGPSITGVNHNPKFPTDKDEVNICANVTDVSGVAEYPILHIEAAGFSADPDMDDLQGEGVYCKDISSGTIDAEDGMVVTYYISAVDGEGNPSEVGPFYYTYDGVAPAASFVCEPTDGNETLTVVCTSTSTDTVDEELDHVWTFVGGNPESSTNTEEEVVYQNNGNYTVSLTVKDDAGHNSTTTANGDIEVFDVGPSAGFSADPDRGNEQLTVEFTDESTSHDELVSWEWNFGDGETSTEQNPEHTYEDSSEEAYNVTLTVCDADGDCSTVTGQVYVSNVEPEVSAGGPYTCNEGETITLTATATDVPGDYPLIYLWDLDGEEGYEAEGQSVEYTCENGNAAVSVLAQATDNDGGSASDSALVTINNIAPSADANGPYETAVGREVCFTGSASDAYDEEFNYAWDFDYDGEFDTNGESQTSCTSYEESGTYTVGLIVNDGDDNSEVATTTVTVYDYGIELNEGQNLISIPLVPENTDVEAVLNGVNPEVVWAYKYNSETGENQWYVYAEGAGDLDGMIPGYGYYVLMEDNSDVLYNNGEKYYNLGNGIPLPPQVTLVPGWNLIGHYGLNEVDKEEEFNDLAGSTLTDLAEVTLLGENAAPEWDLTPGEGYWAFIIGQSNVLYAPSEADYDEEYDD